MRKPRDYDSELKALSDKARQLKARKQGQLGELVAATGADTLTAQELAGALLDIVIAAASPARKEAWHKAGVAFFSGTRTKPGNGPHSDNSSAAPDGGSAASGASQTGAA
ncbi:hypothetical protein WSK_4321 [Novosphingobium sp. Rr 2-17]|uniref:conjugal transfer protein TraD n=1 Tax=Novosphingobium sp. Rr 2-17 TaxID=555793 RepID=UPI0002697F1C|nr:conjugal transfer protein TraD [Novosphingobium sp. Rr 2-17]EIZ77115.1 hypothetical protein WSK_4321 [Novosphingobium sp. Rr 2-17]